LAVILDLNMYTHFMSVFSGSCTEAPTSSKQGSLYYTCTKGRTSLLRPVVTSLKEALFKVKITEEKLIIQESLSACFKIL